MQLNHAPVSHAPVSLCPQNGFTLLEVMVATFILAIGLLGIAGLHIVSLENTNGAYLRSQALMLSQDIVERMRSNPQQVAAGAFNQLNSNDINTTIDQSCLSATTGCSYQQLATIDIAQWAQAIKTVNQSNVKQLLPNAVATVTKNSNGINFFDIKIEWQTKRWQHDEASERAFRRVNAKASYQVQVVIN